MLIKLSCGMVHGSILGPVLYAIYVPPIWPILFNKFCRQQLYNQGKKFLLELIDEKSWNDHQMDERIWFESQLD
jgi:hypothetical protein